MRHGGRILADQLRAQGCRRVFLVPGESYLAVLDGLYDVPEIEPVVCRQEGGAAMMADAHGKLTGEPGVCFVTRGPGATNASAGVHIAYQDSTPMILFIGQVGSDMVDREAFQEVDYRQMFAPLAKWAAQIDRVDRIPEYVSQAYHIAQSGRPGPVVLALPEDMLRESAVVKDAVRANPAKARPGQDDMSQLAHLLKMAERPIMMVGGPGWSDQVRQQVEAFCDRAALPVCSSFRTQDYIDNRHPSYVGHSGIGPIPSLKSAIEDADLLIVVGARLGEMTTSGYSLVESPNPKQTLVHIHPSASEIGRVYRPELAIVSTAQGFAEALSQVDVAPMKRDQDRVGKLHEAYLSSLTPIETPGDVKMEEVVKHVDASTDDRAIICNGAGNYAGWVHRYYRFRSFRTQLAPTSGSMGYGLPAAVAAKLDAPDQEVICFAGDGCFMMHGQELATAMKHNLDITIIVSNNGTYGTIRMHQERDYPRRVSGTDLSNPNFAKLAEAYGAWGVRVERTADFPAAFAAARAHKGPALIELMTSSEAISFGTTITKLRGGA
jgi:acetolactate synthase-1/2/3 large subunit